MQLRLALIACVALGLASREALALPFCEEGKPDVEAASEHALPEPDAPVLAALEAGKDDGKDDARVVLPCVLAEMGSTCADATFYVVTPQGLLLCQIDIPALSHQGLPEVERPPASPSAWSAFFAAAVPAGAVALPAALVRDLPAMVLDDDGVPADGFTRLSCPPS